METENLSEVLSSNYMLASLTIRSWSGRKTDKDATADLLAQKGAASNAASVVKSLLAGNDKELKDTQAAYNRIRTWFYANSLPWTTESEGRQQGNRLVGTMQAMDFLRDFGQLQTAAEEAREKFINAYDSAVQNAATSLGTLYDPSQYPHKDSLKSLFGATMEIIPMPDVSDFSRVTMPAPLVQGLQRKYEKSAEKHVSCAVIAAQERIIDELKRMMTQLNKVVDEEPVRLHKTLISNLQTVAGLAGSLGPLSPELGEVALEIRTELLTHEAQDFKDNAALARTKSEAAGRILKKLQPNATPTIPIVVDAVSESELETDSNDDGHHTPDLAGQFDEDSVFF